MKHRGATKSRINSAKPSDDKVVISSKYYENERPSYICSFCNQTLIRLTDAGQNNISYWCRHCSVEFDPESENLRKESKLVVPDRNIEPAATSIQNNMANEVEIRYTPEMRGGFAQLARKGTIRFTSYQTTEKE
jgi:DNA-directed RNA polymerase subunit RPC12/RpoP